MSEVLALKYRPHSFESLIGQRNISQTLSLALDSNRLSHAYLFSGLRGSGKTSTARIFAKSLICDRGPTSKPCEICENCKSANGGSHIDIIEIDGASNRKIDDIRDLIEQTKYSPNMARFKIFIIDEVHMLTKEAFNALLKTLEEPPSYIKFILATTDPLKVPVTILSRTQHFRFQKIAKEDITNHLTHILNLENINYEPEALDILARVGGGSLRDTLTMVEQAIIFSKGRIDTVSVTAMYGMLDPKFIEVIFETIFAKDKDKVLEIIKEIETYEAEMIIMELIEYTKEKFFLKDSRFSTILSERFFKILAGAKDLIFLNVDNNFLFTILFFKMIEALNIKTIDDMIETLEKDIQDTPMKNLNRTPKKIEPKLSNGEKKFIALVAKIYDKDRATADCFKNSIKFQDFKDGELIWISCAKADCKNRLRQYYSMIKHYIYEIFGLNTKITMKPCQESAEVKKKEPKLEQPTPKKQEEEQTSSYIAEVLGVKSKEFDGKEMLDSKFIQHIINTFDIRKIKIISNV